MAHICIIDDSPTDVHALSTMLAKGGHRVSSAPSAEQGIALVKRERPDLVIMDVIMPGINGFQATRMLSRDPETAKIPIIVVSSKNQETDRLWALRQGAKEYVVKPVKDRELIAKINSVLGNPQT